MASSFYYTGDEKAWLESIESKGYKDILLVADAKSNGFCIPLVKQLFPILSCSKLIVLPDGEHNKTMDVCQLLWQHFQQVEVNKSTLIVAVGGGVLTDLVGFAAATYMRGIDCTYIPTTLMAMADASIGGKTAIDFLGIKNLIGAFAFPTSIYINPVFLKTLPVKQLKNGAAEIIKHCILQGGSAWKQLENMSMDDFCLLSQIKQSVEFKCNVVSGDFKDHHQRQMLNFGHTIGHAMESAMLNHHRPLMHGEAIILGMDVELKLSKRLLQFPDVEFSFWCKLKSKFYPHLTWDLPYELLASFLRSDKKNDEHIRMSLLRAPGNVELQVKVPEPLIKQVLHDA